VSDGLTSDQPGLPRPYEQQVGETDVAYGAFVVYRSMPTNERSASRVASEYSRHVRLITRWRSRWFWVERARAWDAKVDEENRRAQVAARVKMGERQAVHAEMLQRALIAPVQALLVKLADLIDREELGRLTVPELLALSVMTGRVWPAAARAEREARGAPVPEYDPPAEGDVAEPATVLDSEEELAEIWLALEAAGLAPKPRELGPGTNGHGPEENGHA
jgi:hypothetical protein